MNKYDLILKKICSDKNKDKIPLCQAADLLQKIGYREKIEKNKHVFIDTKGKKIIILSSKGLFLNENLVDEVRKIIKNNYSNINLNC